MINPPSYFFASENYPRTLQCFYKAIDSQRLPLVSLGSEPSKQAMVTLRQASLQSLVRQGTSPEEQTLWQTLVLYFSH